jgi:hypothetical protein
LIEVRIEPFGVDFLVVSSFDFSETEPPKGATKKGRQQHAGPILVDLAVSQGC